MDGMTVARDICMRHDELLQRGIDLVKIDIRNEAVDAGINAGRLPSMQITLRGNELGEHAQIRKPARVGGIGRVTPDALKIIALKVEFLRFAQSGLGQVRVFPQ
jgi:hypothetical protein